MPRVIVAVLVVFGCSMPSLLSASLVERPAMLRTVSAAIGRDGGGDIGALSRCRARNGRGQRAEKVVPSIVDGSTALASPQLQPRDVVLGHGPLWVLSKAVREANPGFDVSSGGWGLKFPWFRVKPGMLTIQGRRIDGPGIFRVSLPPDGSYPDTGFLPSGLRFSNGGCWKVTGKLRGTTITFYIAFSSTPNDICSQIASQLQNIAEINNPENDMLAAALQASYQSRGCSPR
jgi:hypothetical protein